MEFKTEFEMEISKTETINCNTVNVNLIEAGKSEEESWLSVMIALPHAAVDLNKTYYVTIATEGADID